MIIRYLDPWVPEKQEKKKKKQTQHQQDQGSSRRELNSCNDKRHSELFPQALIKAP